VAKEASLVLTSHGKVCSVDALLTLLNQHEWPVNAALRAWSAASSNLGEGCIATVKQVDIAGVQYAMKVSMAGYSLFANPLAVKCLTSIAFA
jgi:hypothetical protein